MHVFLKDLLCEKHLVLLRTHCWTPYFQKVMILIDFIAAAGLILNIKMSSC